MKMNFNSGLKKDPSKISISQSFMKIFGPNLLLDTNQTPQIQWWRNITCSNWIFLLVIHCILIYAYVIVISVHLISRGYSGPDRLTFLDLYLTSTVIGNVVFWLISLDLLFYHQTELQGIYKKITHFVTSESNFKFARNRLTRFISIATIIYLVPFAIFAYREISGPPEGVLRSTSMAFLGAKVLTRLPIEFLKFARLFFEFIARFATFTITMMVLLGYIYPLLLLSSEISEWKNEQCGGYNTLQHHFHQLNKRLFQVQSLVQELENHFCLRLLSWYCILLLNLTVEVSACLIMKGSPEYGDLLLRLYDLYKFVLLSVFSYSVQFSYRSLISFLNIKICNERNFCPVWEKRFFKNWARLNSFSLEVSVLDIFCINHSFIVSVILSAVTFVVIIVQITPSN